MFLNDGKMTVVAAAVVTVVVKLCVLNRNGIESNFKSTITLKWRERGKGKKARNIQATEMHLLEKRWKNNDEMKTKSATATKNKIESYTE